MTGMGARLRWLRPVLARSPPPLAPDRYGAGRTVAWRNTSAAAEAWPLAPGGAAPHARRMSSQAQLAEVAALVGDPARANMLMALSDGRALTATELAYLARITPQTASGHLAKLVDGRLLAVTQQGRHRYFRLASPLVGRMLESINAMASLEGPPRHRPRPADDALRRARFCYDHLAGRLGVALADALVARGHVEFGEDGGAVTPEGGEFLARFGLDLAPRRAARSAARASTGASGARTSPARSAPASPPAASRSAGSSASATRAR
jgi:DNA-binding transcriptional ArsR family regulator